jgi:hypothetical protein
MFLKQDAANAAEFVRLEDIFLQSEVYVVDGYFNGTFRQTVLHCVFRLLLDWR